MRWSKSYAFTLREISEKADEIPSYKLMMKAGLIKKVAPGIYTYHHITLKALQKLKNIIRKHLNSKDCIEILMPMVHPRSLWDETNRWKDMGEGLLKFQNRNKQEFCLAPTHEEVITDLVRHDLKSYKDLPKNLYQIQTKYRDEIRPRFGLLRGREFIMKDAYSFDLNEKTAIQSYQKMKEAYIAIFDELQLDYKVVQADSGNIGGNYSEEFHILADHGEDALMVCQCQQAYNLEIAPTNKPAINKTKADSSLPAMEKFATPQVKTIKQLAKLTGLTKDNLVKTLFFKQENGQPFCVLLKGSNEVAPIKLKNYFHWTTPPEMLSNAEVLQLTGANPGSCGPVGLHCDIFADHALCHSNNYIVGANKDGFHLKNVNPNRDFKIKAFGDFHLASDQDDCPQCLSKYKKLRGIEVGHIFYLGLKYSKAMNATYLDSQGKRQSIEMGCYGLGVSRSLQAMIEQKYDKHGIQWSLAIAPYHVHICHLDIHNSKACQVVDMLEKKLEKLKIDVFIDDRDERPGVKFKDADLLGFPFRITVGKRNLIEANPLEDQTIELVERSHLSQVQKLNVQSTINHLTDKLLKCSTSSTKT